MRVVHQAPLLLLVSLATASATPMASDSARRFRSNATSAEDDALSRQKRFIAYNYDERRITFPPGTLFILTPTIAVPFIRNMAKGFGSDMTISVPLKMSFDDFGWTDEFNPWGIVPGISLAREADPADGALRENGGEGDGMGGGMGGGDGGGGGNRRYKRSRENYTPHPLGDRLVLFEMIEDYLMNLGHDGKACLLRAICETNEHPLPYHGLFGEFLQMLFTVSMVPFGQELMTEYVKAEKSGKERGACWQYYKDCQVSLFSTVTENKYRKSANTKNIKERMNEFDTFHKMGLTNTIR